MKKRFIFIALPTVAVALLGFSWLRGGQEELTKQQRIQQYIMAVISQVHYSPLVVNDDFSNKVFDMYIKRMDPTKRFLIAEDVEKLKVHRSRIDDEINNGSFGLLADAAKLMSERTKEAKGYYTEILAAPFDFGVNESHETDPDKRKFSANKQELKEEWRKYLKFQALVRFASLQEEEKKKAENAKKDGKPYTAKTDKELEETARKEILRNHNNWFDRLEKLDEDDRFAEYMNAITAIYCPHTEYFPPEDKENFDISMTGKLEGIGAQLQQADGEIKVSNIVPGSASWRQKELKEGDQILKVAQGEEEPVDVTGMILKDAVRLIRGKKGTEVRLTVKKPDGLIKVIPIIRDVVIFEEAYAKSSILEDPQTKRKFGYILLPSFYADFSNSGGRNSGADVRQEVLKLKKQGIDGIILDLRNNGGGSLQDAVNMAGLFITSGPTVQVKTQGNSPLVLQDPDPAIVYDGPMVVMTNRLSASASEIVAGALQDYGRAVIVGSNSFGKGTVQRFYDLNQVAGPSIAGALGGKPANDLGSIKLTVQKFYRVSGKATQVRGVTPDVTLPDLYDDAEVGEKELDYVMPFDEISAAKYAAFETRYEVKKLAKASEKRVKTDEVFNLIAQNAERLKRQRTQSLQSLQLNKYKEEQEKLRKEAEQFEKLKKLSYDDFSIIALEAAKAEGDSIRQAQRDDWFKQMRQDAHLRESLYVLKDMLNAKEVAQK